MSPHRRSGYGIHAGQEQIKDFKTWKPAYDAHQAARAEAGLTEKYLLRNADNVNEIVILFEVLDLKRAKTFAAPQTCARRCKNLAL